MSFSRTLAVIFGLLAPLAETIRRWSTWREYPPAILDDYLMGALLLWGAWSVHQGVAVIKGVGLALAIVALVATLRSGEVQHLSRSRATRHDADTKR